MSSTGARRRHTDKHIESAIQYAESLNWVVKISRKGHAWGRLFCPFNDRDGCIISVWSTPQNAENHAKNIRRIVDRCDHDEKED